MWIDDLLVRISVGMAPCPNDFNWVTKRRLKPWIRWKEQFIGNITEKVLRPLEIQAVKEIEWDR